MAIKLSGPLSFDSDIVREFISDNAIPADFRPHSLSEYYRLGEYVPDADPQNQDIPLDSSVNPIGLEEIKFSDFYGAVNQINVDFFKDPAQPTNVNSYLDKNGTQQNVPINSPINMSTIANSFVSTPSPTGPHSVPYKFKFNNGVVFNNSIQTGGSFDQLIIENEGLIAGRGGNGGSTGSSGSGGQPAIKVTHNNTQVTIDNFSGGIIVGGGGGGGGGSASRNPSTGYPATARSGGGGGWNGGNGGNSSANVSPHPTYPVRGTGSATGGSGKVITSPTSFNQGDRGGWARNYTISYGNGGGPSGAAGGYGGGAGGNCLASSSAEGSGADAQAGGGGGNALTPNSAPGGTSPNPGNTLSGPPGFPISHDLRKGAGGGSNNNAGSPAQGGGGGGGWGAAGGSPGPGSAGKAIRKYASTNVSISYTPSAGIYYGTKDT